MAGNLTQQDRSRLSELTLDPSLASGGWQLAFLGDESEVADTVFNPALNAALATGWEMPISRRETEFAPDDAWIVEKRVAEMIAAGKTVFDAPKLRLHSDPAVGHPAELEATTYFNGLATNDLCLKSYRPCDNLEIDGTERAFPKGVIPRLSRSRMSNHLGAASLAFDDDGVVCLCVAASAAAVASGKVAPSAAGSLDMTDIDDVGSITEAVRGAIDRELAEETGLDPKTAITTRVIGFIRDLNRGAKPEFIAVSRVHGRWAEVAGSLGEEELKFTASHIMLDTADLGTEGMHRWMSENSHRTSYALKTAWEFLCLEMSRPGSDVPILIGHTTSR